MPGTFSYDDTLVSWCDGIGDHTAIDGVTLDTNDDFTGRAWGSASPSADNEVCDFERGVGFGGVSIDLGAMTTWDATAEDISWQFLYTAKTGEVLASSDAVRVRLRSTTSATDAQFLEYILTGAVNGGDFFYPNPIIKSWNPFILSGARGGVQNGTGSTDLTAIRWFECRFEWIDTNTGNQEPGFALEWQKLGRQFSVTDGTSAAPADFPSLKIFSDLGPGTPFVDPEYKLVFGADVFFELWAGMIVGNGTTSTYFAAENIFCFNNQYSQEVQHDWEVTNNATLRLGKLDQQTQRDYPVNGCTFVLPDEVRIADFDINNGATVEWYAGKFFRWKTIRLGEAAAGTDPTIDIRGYDFDTVQSIEFRSTNLDMVDTRLHDPLPTFLNAGQAWQDDNGTFTSVTTNWNNTTTTTAIFPSAEAIGDGHAVGFSEQFGSLEFEISTAGVGGAITWQYWNGAWTDLTNVVDNTNNFLATASEGSFDRYRVTWDLPSDWVVRNINSTGNLYYVRAVIDTVYSTNPQIQQGRVGQRRLGILVDAPNTLSNVEFFKCDRALYFQASVTVTGYQATDNAYDVVVDDTLTVTLVNSVFDPDKILQV